MHKARPRRAVSGKRSRGKRRRCRPPAGPDYWVQETDEDMLLVVRNGVPQREARPRVTKTLGKTIERWATSRGDPGPWGERLPPELLHRVLRLLAASEGAIPALCRVSRVCRLWRFAAADPGLWQDVSLGFCWVDPGKKQLLHVKKKVCNTVQWLTENRFSLLRRFTLNHWKNNVAFVVKTLGETCHHLNSLKLLYCSVVTTDCLLAVALNCPELESLNLQNSQVDASAVGSFLEVAGSRLRQIWLTYNSRMNSILNLISSGCCSVLQLLEVTTDMSQDARSVQLPIEALQAGCPQLQVLRLLNLIWSPKGSARAVQESLGFPELVELCLATSSFSVVDDELCFRILRTSCKLCVLDLRGCYRVTPAGLVQLPCTEVRQLYLGLYCTIQDLTLCRVGSYLLTRTWHHSLRELDLTGQCYGEADLEVALANLAQGGENVLLCSLNLAGTKVTLNSVRNLIRNCTALTYLNLTSCRYLPRGMKRVYRGQEDIQQCLQLLLPSQEDSTEHQDGSEGRS
ncbi:F-box/LRR-repeat protein 6 [Rhinatrema bivittatum]|uniref:F-box/LRR-repeat protein 6 n=1 Tax=Rhinatrema bivittatum TaxID=194408 RepID=UPI0011272629|nr:F-box/LRR-repeat protein 6 [Rhinatrema bivittatum]